EASDADRLDAAVGSWLDARLHAVGQAAGHGWCRRRAVAWTARRCGVPVTPAPTASRYTCWPPSISAVVLCSASSGWTARPTRSPGRPPPGPSKPSDCAQHEQNGHDTGYAEALEVAVLLCRTVTAPPSQTVTLPDVACARLGDPRGHQGLEGIGPQAIGTAGEVPLLEVCTCGVVHDLEPAPADQALDLGYRPAGLKRLADRSRDRRVGPGEFRPHVVEHTVLGPVGEHHLRPGSSRRDR